MDSFSFAKFDFSEITGSFNYSRGRVSVDDQEVMDVLLSIFSTIQRNMDYWDERCWFTRKKYGKHLLNSAAYIESPDYRSAIHGVILSVYAFYVECKYWSHDYVFDTTDPGIYFNNLISAMQRSEFYKDLIPEFVELEMEVYRETVRSRVNNETFHKLYDEVHDRENVLKKVNSLSSYLDSKTELVEALDKKLSSLKTAYNFVGLYKGFEDLFNRRTFTRMQAVKFVHMLGLFLIFPPLLMVISVLFSQIVHGLSLDKYFTLVTFLGVPTLSIEILLLYFFRLKYMEVKSIDAQLLQLELRMSLCQFIESYSSFAVDMHKGNHNLLAGFESIIFSPIVANESDIPPLIDGANQLVELFKARK